MEFETMTHMPKLGDRNELRAKPGDMAVCFKCGEILVFTDDLGLRQSDLNDMAKIAPFERENLGRAQRLVRRDRPYN